MKAVNKLMDYDWPGNVRELENVLGRAIIFLNYNETIIEIQHLPDLQSGQPKGKLEHIEQLISTESLSVQMEKYEAKIIRDTLEVVNGNKTLASKKLGVSVRNLYYKLEKHGIEIDSMQ